MHRLHEAALEDGHEPRTLLAYPDLADDAASGTSFGDYLRDLRRRLAGKQYCLSLWIGCTEAALSHWESGSRLPNSKSFAKLLAALAKAGASTAEIHQLRLSWYGDTSRRALSRILRNTLKRSTL